MRQWARSTALQLGPNSHLGGVVQRNQNRINRLGKADSLKQPISKRTWHPLTLQQLHQGQFIDAVNEILSGRCEVFRGSLKGATGVHEDRRAVLGATWN